MCTVLLLSNIVVSFPEGASKFSFSLSFSLKIHSKFLISKNFKKVLLMLNLLKELDLWISNGKSPTEYNLTMAGQTLKFTAGICARGIKNVWGMKHGVVVPTGRPLLKVLPCPNKGSRSCFVNVPLRRYISFNVHRPGTLHMYRQFSAYTQLLCGLQFSLRNLS